jgi:hypothetical protein
MNPTETKAWTCGKCSRSWPTPELATSCCSPAKCRKCGIECERPRTICGSCRELMAQESFEAAPRGPLPADTPFLYSDALNEYMLAEDLVEYVDDAADTDGNEEEQLQRLISSLRLYLTAGHKPSHFNLSEHFGDFLPTEEDDAEPPGWKEAEKAVNDYLQASRPWSYISTKTAWDGTYAAPAESEAQP